ncbi:MAG: peptidoglycan-binding domain-containing protein [Lachnospiraceae bacterium]|nr:peptidoglycan-binding domain-containing protein [Lachnospiraceae bacterium]
MRKKKSVLMLLTMLLILVLSNIASAGQMEFVGNVTYDVPENWLKSSKTNDDTITNTYIGDNFAMIVTYMDADLDGYDASIQRMMLNATMQSIEDYDNYSEWSNEDCIFEGNVANARLFTYDDAGTNYTTMSFVIYTGQGIAMFLFGGETSVMGNESIDAFLDVVDTVKTTDSKNSVTEKELDYEKYSANFYKVGTDIPAGEYVVFAESGHGYFCVSSDSNQDNIIFNDNFDYNSIITVKDGEYLELSRCYAVPFEEGPEIDLSGTGMFKVGTHISAGEYKIESTDGMGYYCIYPDSRQDDIVSNDNFEGQNYITVTDGQYLVLSRCKFTELPEKPMKSYIDAETIIKVQEALNAAGYDCGTPDGIAGSGTIGQIEKYQTDKGLIVTGTITDEVLESLGI